MISYAQLDPRRSGFQAGRALAYYAQRIVTPMPLRRAVTGGIAFAIRRRHGEAPPAPPGLREELARLQRDGLAMMPPLFAADALRDVQAHFLATPVVLGGGRRMPVAEVPAGTRSAAYDMPAILDCPHVLAAVNDPALLGLAAAYLGCKPTLSSLGVRWSFPKGDGRDDVQAWHRDCDDWRTVKLFVYLTDVTPASGPHVYVQGSHRTRASLRNARFTEAALTARYGADSLRSVTGPQGTTFMADVAGVHRGVPPQAAPRLILQAQYSVLPIQCFAYAPLAREAAGLDPYTNRLILRG